MQPKKIKTGTRKKNIYNNYQVRTQERMRPKKHTKRLITYENDYIFWCHECNVPILEPQCFTCKNNGIRLQLSQPADVRFCSPFERKILADQLISEYNSNPLGDRIILLNKIPGDDKTDEVIVDGLHFGILRFDLPTMDYKFDLLLEGAKVLLAHTEKKTVVIKRSKRHLSGKNIGFDQIENHTDDIKKGDHILVVSGNLSGFGTAYTDSSDISSTEGAVLKIKKIDSNPAVLNEKIPDMDDIVNANLPYIRQLGKNAMNTIKGIANQKQHKKLPVHVSFSGGKDSLVVLDLAQSALKKRPVKAFIVNTGLEFPETIDFARDYCKQNNIDLHEANAGGAFWEHLDKFGPPAKDFRWCCKVCKLAPASTVIEECANNGAVCLTIDGKRKHESFSRARVAASEMNPFVPDQLNIFPIRDWRAIEVWLYIHWRGLAYNPLYDMGFERVGCHLCPAALSAEYKRMRELHPDMYDRWNNYLIEWAHAHELSNEFIEHGFWRWKELPPKMLKLAEELDIGIKPVSVGKGDGEAFSIHVTSGVSPCKAGGFSVEGIIGGVSTSDAANIMNIIGKNVYSKELGMLRVEADTGSINIFASGSILVNANGKDEAFALFKDAAKQLMRVNKCTKCGICIKVCPTGAIRIDDGDGIGRGLHIDDSCTRCGKCTEACVVIKYFDKLMPDLGVLSTNCGK